MVYVIGGVKVGFIINHGAVSDDITGWNAGTTSEAKRYLWCPQSAVDGAACEGHIGSFSDSEVSLAVVECTL